MDLNRLERETFPIARTFSLSGVGSYFSLRCDAKQAERRFAVLDEYFSAVDCFYLNEVLPSPIVKGPQPRYLELEDPNGVPVLSTFCVQPLHLVVENARYIAQEEFDAVPADRKPRRGDLLLTVDGGPSIGKPAVFDLPGNYGVDSHVAILRPTGVGSELLALLLASPLGQAQFKKAESGASGQTAVTEEDIRRFRFPRIPAEAQEEMVRRYRDAAARARQLRAEADQLERDSWERVVSSVLTPPTA